MISSSTMVSSNLSAKSAASYSSSKIAIEVSKLGAHYERYARQMVANGLDGEMLSSLTEAEFIETLDDLRICNRLHRRVLLKTFLKQVKSKQVGSGDSYGYTPYTPPDELKGYDRVIEQILNSESAVYAGVHLVLRDGQLSLSSHIRKGDSVDKSARVHLPHDQSICSEFVREMSCSYLMKRLDGTRGGYVDPFYQGHVLLDEDGLRVGAICVLDTESVNRQNTLRELAKEVEELLSQKKALEACKRSPQPQVQAGLTSDIESSSFDGTQSVVDEPKALVVQDELEGTNDDEVVLEGNGLVRAVTVGDIKKKRMSSRIDPSAILAAQLHMKHIPQSFHETSAAFRHVEQPPILQNDVERVAVFENLDVTSVDPRGTLATSLKKLMAMAAKAFNVQIAEISLLNHETQFTLARHFADDDILATMMNFCEVLKANDDGKPFLCQANRAAAICNYPVARRSTFVVNDMSEDERFQWVYRAAGLRFYAGSPIIDPSGHVIAVLCLLDSQAHYDFSEAHEIQFEQITQMVLQNIENWTLRREIENLERERQTLAMKRKKTCPPEHQATFIVTDVEGSTSLWEANPAAMQTALDLHDSIMREYCALHRGYEIDTEGDSFSLAFHDQVDAFAFALDVQIALNEADWSREILELGNTPMEGSESFRGLRVRMGIHGGEVECRDNPVTKRRQYCGEAWNLVKNVESMAHGGQIVATSDTWNVASYMAASSLGSPQVLDLGSHVLRKGKLEHDGVITKHLIQLVPASLSFDYFGARRLPSERGIEMLDTDAPAGRIFPPLQSSRQVGLSFHDSPFVQNDVTMAFFSLSASSNHDEDTEIMLAKLVGRMLVGTTGYQCQSNMLAFSCEKDAVKFGLKLLKCLKERENISVHTDEVVIDAVFDGSCLKYGAVRGEFLTMGPHRTTGRADYFGKVVNRAARVASAAKPGSVAFGVVAGDEASSPNVGNSRFLGLRDLKGVQGQIALFECYE